MSIPDEGYPLAAAVSPRLQVTETTDSTNADLVKAVAADPEQWPHLSLILTTDQRAGRGRLDRTWTARPVGSGGIRARAGRRSARRRTRMGSARGRCGDDAGRPRPAARDAHRVTVKWPNDVLLNGGKLSGILAEVVRVTRMPS